jgi:hypothetical protein
VEDSLTLGSGGKTTLAVQGARWLKQHRHAKIDARAE